MICLWRHIHLRYHTLYRSVYTGVSSVTRRSQSLDGSLASLAQSDPGWVTAQHTHTHSNTTRRSSTASPFGTVSPNKKTVKGLLQDPSHGPAPAIWGIRILLLCVGGNGTPQELQIPTTTIPDYYDELQ